MMRAVLMALASLSIASPAVALSCMAPDVTEAYRIAQHSDDRYIVVRGTLRFDASKLPKTLNNNNRPHNPIPARITGEALTKSGFDFAFDRDITLDVECFGPWCGAATPDTLYLAFLRQGENGYVMSPDPCHTLSFPEPTQDMLDRVALCFKEGSCAR